MYFHGTEYRRWTNQQVFELNEYAGRRHDCDSSGLGRILEQLCSQEYCGVITVLSTSGYECGSVNASIVNTQNWLAFQSSENISIERGVGRAWDSI